MKGLEEAAGVGVEVSAEEIAAAVAAVVEANGDSLREMRYHCNQNVLLGQVRARVKWADVAAAKKELETQVCVWVGWGLGPCLQTGPLLG